MKKYKSPPNKTNLVGQKFGKLTVLEETEKRTKAGLVIYKCQCKCGNIVEVNSNHLRTRHTKSCGCQKNEIDNLEGQKFGRLKVVSFNKRKKGYTWWNCHCDCGNDVVISSTALKRGSTKSCGCLNTEVRSKTAKERFGLIDGTSKSNISEKINFINLFAN